MNCEHFEQTAQLLDFEDVEARAHAQSCEACTALLQELDSDRELLRAAPVPEMRMPAPRRRPVLWQWAAVAAAVLISLLLWPQDREIEQLAVRVPAPPVVDVPSPSARVEVRQKPQLAAAKKEVAPSLAQALQDALPPEGQPMVAANTDVVVAMQTEDPDVVIVLVGGDSND